MTPDGLLLVAVGGPRLRQPARRRAQPGARAAARRRPGAQGGRLGRHRQHAPRHHRRRVGWPGRGRPGAALADRAGARCSGSRPTSSTTCWRSSSRCSCGPARPPPSTRRRSAAGSRPWSPATWPGGRSPSPRSCPLAEAVRRAQEAEAGGIVTVTSGGAPSRGGQRGRAARHPRGPPPLGRHVARWPATSTTACACRPTSRARTWSGPSPAPRPTEYLLVEDDGSLYGVLPPRTSTGPSGRAPGTRRRVADSEPTAGPASAADRCRQGEWVRLVDSKGRRHNFCLEAGQAVLLQPRGTSTTTS